MKKRRINFYYCASTHDALFHGVMVVETALAINGIKAIGYTRFAERNQAFDWEMQQNNAEESIIKACDMVIIDNPTLTEEKAGVLREAERWNVPVYAFQGEDAQKEICNFQGCVFACRALLGRSSGCDPILIR